MAAVALGCDSQYIYGRSMRTKAIIGCIWMLALAACQDNIAEIEAAHSLHEQGSTEFMASLNSDALTRMELDGLSLRWTAGDEITIFGTTAENGFHSEVFTTDDSGHEATFLGNDIATASSYYAFYPSSSVKGMASGGNGITAYLQIPVSQTAVANGIANHLNICYAKATDNRLYFRNVCAFIKFRLNGGGVSDIRSIRLTACHEASAPLALSGEATLQTDDGTISGITGYDYVELQGSFEEGGTYYLMCAPAELSKGFTLTMSNAEGMEHTISGQNAVSLHPSEVLNLGSIDIGWNDFINGNATSYLTNSSSHPVSWVVIPEGFTLEQMDDYHRKATEMLDFIFNVEPFRQYKSYFNVHILDAVSAEEGADVFDKSQYVETFFDAGWSSIAFGNMKANNEKVFSFVKAYSPDILNGKVSIQETGIIMLINDSRYGGICYNWSDGKAFSMVPVSKNSDGTTVLKWAGNGGSQVTCEGTWLNVALHESGGHMFGRLADEYVGSASYSGTVIPSHNYAVPFGLNITADIENNLLWSEFIPDSMGIRQAGRFLHVGTYEGALGAYGKGIWRSEEVSCMDDTRTYFSAWQRYLIAKRIHDLAQEPFTYADFIANDSQYHDIQAGIRYAGTEGIITTFFNLDGIRYGNTSLVLRQKPYTMNSSGIMPPLPSPVLIEVK